MSAAPRLSSTHALGELRQGQRLLHRRVAAANHGGHPVAQQRPIAGGAMTDALAVQSGFARYAELLQRRSGRDDHGACRELAVAGHEPPRLALLLEALQHGRHKFRAGGIGLFLRHRAEVVARNAVRVAGKALDLLDAQKLSADDIAGEHQRPAAELCGRHPGRHPGNSAAGDDDVVSLAHGLKYRSRIVR